MITFNTYREAVMAYSTSNAIYTQGGVFSHLSQTGVLDLNNLPEECKPSDYLKPLSSMVGSLVVGDLYVCESDGIVREVNHPMLYVDNPFISDCYFLDRPESKE